MEVEFYKCHSMGTDYITIDNRSGRYDGPLHDKKFCARMLSHNYGIGGVYINEIRHRAEDGRYEIRFINRQGNEGFYGGSNVATMSVVAKKLGLFEDDCFPIRNKGKKYQVNYNSEFERFSFNFDDFHISGIRPIDEGYFMNLNYPHFVHLVDDVQSVDVNSLGQKLQNTAPINEPSFSVTFFQRTDQDDTFLARTCSGASSTEIPYCGSGSLAIALINERLKLKESDGATEHQVGTIKTAKVRYPGGSVQVSYAIDQDFQFTDITLGLHGTYVFKGQMPYINDNRSNSLALGTI